MLVKSRATICVDEVINADELMGDFAETIRGLKWAAVVLLDKAGEPTNCRTDTDHYLYNIEAIVTAMAYISTTHKAISDYKDSPK